MDMDYMDQFHHRYPAMAMQPFAGQQQTHPQNAQYPYWNPLMAYYQQQHRAAALMGQGAMHLAKPAEPKPWLAKDEVDLLEREFSKNQKPSSSTKRELAEQMGVEVPRINVC
jgi:delta 1-pyrroline-5-carboxylate dehydrogenase